MANENLKWAVVDYSGKEVETISLDGYLFGLTKEEQSPYAVQAAVKTYLANRRQATAKTKNRSEVSGSGKKLWRQKGTGRARMGNNRSPVWRHGGIVFGPRGNQNYKLKLNKRVNDLALASALSDKVLDKALIVLTDKPFTSNKTKDFSEALKAINGGEKKTLIVLGELDENLVLAARNLANVELTSSSDLCVYDILNCDSLIIVKNALPEPFEDEVEIAEPVKEEKKPAAKATKAKAEAAPKAEAKEKKPASKAKKETK